jgi:hypothetical protein
MDVIHVYPRIKRYSSHIIPFDHLREVARCGSSSTVHHKLMSDAHRTVASPSLHDCLALGQVELGLANSTTTPTTNNSSNDEVHRLPLLLRWLHQARPWTRVPELIGLEEKQDTTAATTTLDIEAAQQHGETRNEDAVLEEAVARMEDRAALYSVAEGVQLVACHLAPAACLRASRLPPLRRRKPRASRHRPETFYDTAPLMALAQNALAAPKATTMTTGNNTNSPKKQRRSSLSGSGGGGGGGGPNAATSTTDRWEDDPDELHGRGSDGSDLDDHDNKAHTPIGSGDDGPTTLTSATTATNKKRSRKTEKRQSSQALFAQASPDSVEFLVLHTLQELIRLVADSLTSSTGTGATKCAAAAAAATKLSYTDDLLLAEPARPDASSVGGAMDAHDLGVTLVSLLHNAPVLAHEHVAVR